MGAHVESTEEKKKIKFAHNLYFVKKIIGEQVCREKQFGHEPKHNLYGSESLEGTADATDGQCAATP